VGQDDRHLDDRQGCGCGLWRRWQDRNGALQGAAEKGAYAIGVDTDQYFTVPEAQKPCFPAL